MPFAFPHLVAGLIAVLVGYTSSVVLIIQAATAAGADATQGDQQGGGDEGTDGFRQAEIAQAGDEQGGPGGRPGGQHGYAVIKGEADAAHSHANTQRP